ncbi:hypothetical protein [Leyella stercorea]|uniref:hypothetical protein n=1 Tax=Leyella stercorea TaxID=363265 RepID=UPI00242FD647|nr:hypothetical protein [Leyella stercorea]
MFRHRTAYATRSVSVRHPIRLRPEHDDFCCHYFATHTSLTRRILQRVAGLSDSTAKKWLRRLTATGVLQKDGASNAPVYLWRG